MDKWDLHHDQKNMTCYQKENADFMGFLMGLIWD